MPKNLDYRNGRLSDYGISETRGGDPQVFLVFEVEGEEYPTMTYYGSLKPNAIPYTMDAILAVGYKGKDGSELVDGPDSNALVVGTAVSLAIADNEWNGKVTRRISFVNQPSGGGVKRAEPVAAKAKLRALGLEAELAKARALNASAPSKKVNDDDIPF